MTRPSETQMHEQPNSSDHARHDLLAVAALADRDATGEEAVRAQAQVDACTECATLHAELISLATATRQLPAIERPRDFQLRPEDAQRLRPNRIRRLFGSFGTARDGFSRPLAMGLTTLGLAGLMLGILPGTLSFGGAASGQAGQSAGAASEQEIQQTFGAAAPSAPRRPGGAPDAGAGRDQPAGACGFDNGDRHDRSRLGRPGQRFEADESTAVRVASPANRSLTSIADDSTGASQLVVISRDAADRRARAVRPALDLAPLRRLTVGESRPGATGAAVPDGSRRDPPVHLGRAH